MLPMWGKVKVMIWPAYDGVGQDFLIPRDRRVEADLADGLPDRTQSVSGDDGAVGEHEPSRGRRLGPA